MGVDDQPTDHGRLLNDSEELGLIDAEQCRELIPWKPGQLFEVTILLNRYLEGSLRGFLLRVWKLRSSHPRRKNIGPPETGPPSSACPAQRRILETIQGVGRHH